MTKEASEWIEQSVKANANLSNLYLKAQIQAKAGDKAGAIKTAEMALSKATDKDKEEEEATECDKRQHARQRHS